MRFVFKPWNKFRAYKDKSLLGRFLDAVGHEAEDAFKLGLAASKSGIHHPGLPNRSSAPGEFPANQSGDLRGSIDSRVNGINSVTIGSNVYYSKYLLGTPGGMIKPRKMSKEALDAGIPKARHVLNGFIIWRRG